MLLADQSLSQDDFIDGIEPLVEPRDGIDLLYGWC